MLKASQDRKDVLLRAAYDLLKKCSDSYFVLSATSEVTVFYDDADCDGLCLMDDIRNELDLDEGTKPLAEAGEVKRVKS